MAVDHPFRVPLRAGGKEDHGGIFRLLFHLRQVRHQQVSKNPQLIASGDLCFQIFEEDPAHLGKLLRQMPEFAFIEKRA